jgi:hypothetical protein
LKLTIFQTNTIIQPTILLPCTYKVSSSNLCWKTNYPDKFFVVFLSHHANNKVSLDEPDYSIKMCNIYITATLDIRTFDSVTYSRPSSGTGSHITVLHTSLRVIVTTLTHHSICFTLIHSCACIGARSITQESAFAHLSHFSSYPILKKMERVMCVKTEDGNRGCHGTIQGV